MIEDIVKEERHKYVAHNNAVKRRRDEWDYFSKRAQVLFERVINEFERAPFFDKLYIDEGNWPFLQTRNRNTISLRFGAHPTGISSGKSTPNGKHKSANYEIERGGALLFSQAPNGEVICIVCASKSELIKPRDEYFVFRRYESPSLIDEAQMLKAVRVFFWYSRITSYISGFSILNTLQLVFSRSVPSRESRIGTS